MSAGTNITTIDLGATPVAEKQLFVADAAIISKTNPSEIKRVTVVAVYSAPDDQVTGQYDFEVVNVPFA